MVWSVHSWREKPVLQQVDYPDPEALRRVIDKISALPPLVSVEETLRLREAIAKAQRGEAFLLQGGDCAERFIDCAAQPIEHKLRVLLQMSLILTWGGRLPVIRLGRMAGQYAKPRSRPTEMVDGVEMSSYRGDHVNAIEATVQARTPQPERMLESYFRSAATLNYARSLAYGGYSDLRRLKDWDLGFVRSPEKRSKYAELCARIEDALDFAELTGATMAASMGQIDLFTSHEGLSLDYESAQTVRIADKWYNLGAHFLWVGERTRQIDGGHVEYLRGIENPIGVKVGPTMQVDDLLRLLEVLEPKNRPGRITLITRVGQENVAQVLSPLVEAMMREGRNVLWTCDPMHGNTHTTASGYKTRSFNAILSELQQSFQTMQDCGTQLGGVHFELTGEDVTECVGGPQDLQEQDLSRNYVSYCDPRLNLSQSVEMAFMVAERLAQARP